jgi:hypothetical protein
MITDSQWQVTSKLKINQDDLSECGMHIKLQADKKKLELFIEVNICEQTVIEL